MGRKWQNAGEALVEMIRNNKCKKFAEIGVWKSSTTEIILKLCHEEIDEYWAIDQWDVLGPEHLHMSKMKKEDWDRLHARSCKLMVRFPKLKVVRMKSKDAASMFPEKSFDMVFIDASHFYEDVLQDINSWLPLVKEGGIICGHDYNTGQKKGHNVKKAVDEIFPTIQRAEWTIWWTTKRTKPSLI